MRPLLFGCGSFFLFDLFAFAGEGPLAVEGLDVFADGLGGLVYFEVFKDVYAEFAGAGDIHVAVVVEVGGDELGAGAGGAVVGECGAGEDGVRGAVGDLHIG